MEKLIIEVRINEYASRKRNVNVPFSPREICDDAIRCWNEGASIIHYHARDPRSGAPSSDTALYADTARLIKACSDLIVMPTLGAWTMPSPEARMRHIIEMAKDPATRPDFAPIDMGTSNVDVYDLKSRRFLSDDVIYMNPTKTLRYFAETIRASSVRPYMALWNVSAIRVTEAFVECELFEKPLYAGIVLSEAGLFAGNPGTVPGLEAMVNFIPAHLQMHWSVMCVGGDLFPLIKTALQHGGHIAIGLGDFPYAEIGTPRNDELVKRVAAIAREIAREPATPAEARKMLSII
jgi:3-keto-5-aminohexanoate cleavage enzyme